jgi:hypothetical protein
VIRIADNILPRRLMKPCWFFLLPTHPGLVISPAFTIYYEQFANAKMRVLKKTGIMPKWTLSYGQICFSTPSRVCRRSFLLILTSS